jgi:exopolyphosphatase/guanosine-5'-triphosphate,3'-diphosphate pyrophosphatase
MILKDFDFKDNERLLTVIAIIDIGSNTLRLSAYEVDSNGGIRQAYRLKSTAGLAGYSDKKGVLSAKGIAEACAALKYFRSAIEGSDISETHAFAAAGLRNIVNADEVIDTIKRETGFDVTVISGEEEALCGYTGATNGAPMSEGILVDIGGGSTEIVECRGGKVESAISIAVGSMGMYSKHITKVLPTKPQREKIYVEAFEKIKAGIITQNAKMIARDSGLRPESIRRPYTAMYGIGGTMRTLRKLNNAIFGAPHGNYAVNAKNAGKILNLIDTDTRMMLDKILYLTPERVHTITPGLIILSAIIEIYGCETITVSESGVREGYLIRNVLGDGL